MYTLFRGYTDCTTVTETADDIKNLLTAATIYLEDPDCIQVSIWENKNGKVILDYWKDEI